MLVNELSNVTYERSKISMTYLHSFYPCFTMNTCWKVAKVNYVCTDKWVNKAMFGKQAWMNKMILSLSQRKYSHQGQYAEVRVKLDCRYPTLISAWLWRNWCKLPAIPLKLCITPASTYRPRALTAMTCHNTVTVTIRSDKTNTQTTN
jgi:hypothetical protein